jgi:HD superfamily phosphodiesterase
VSKTSRIFNIDESHSLKHSMEVFKIANNIIDSEVKDKPFLLSQKDIIYISAILHDMCDKKYMLEHKGLMLINNYMAPHMPKDKLDVVSNIMSTMSYSKVKIHGYPELNEYQLAYHIVREADLLTAYDIDRCIIYGMEVEGLNYIDALKRAILLFEDRVLKYRSDKLFVTNYSKKLSLSLHKKSLKDIENLKNMF